MKISIRFATALLLALVTTQAHALEPEKAQLRVRNLLERQALGEIAHRVLIDAPRKADFDPRETIVESTTVLGRGKYSAGEFSDFFGTFEAGFHETGTYERFHRYSCRIAAQVKRVTFAKQPGDVFILEHVNNSHQIVARLRVSCAKKD